MNKQTNIIKFYIICNKLKDVIRTGWKDWNVKRERLESVAEHIYGVQMLAIAMWSEFGYDIDLKKVLAMLSIHELEETIIGDLIQFEIDKKTKLELGHQAINQILKNLIKGEEIKSLILEFDKRETPEAKFAYQCDKLECEIQCKMYDEENCVDLKDQKHNKSAKDKTVESLLNKGLAWSEMWINFDQKRYAYDNNFLAVSNYIKDNKLINNK